MDNVLGVQSRHSKSKLMDLRDVPTIRDKIPSLKRKFNYASSLRLRDYDAEIQQVDQDLLPTMNYTNRTMPVKNHPHTRSIVSTQRDSIHD